MIQLLNRYSDILMAMGNSKGIVKRLYIGTIRSQVSSNG
nr:MAG TPA: hypothetical protein [Caudoviricetes sp.]